MELDADDDHHKFIYLDEAGFNLAKTRRRGRNFIGQWATIQVPGQRGANITMCAAISEDGVVGRCDLCHCMGQCQVPSCSCGASLVSGPCAIYHPVFTPILSLP